MRAFEEAAASLPASTVRWVDVASDPNDPAAIAFRAQTLRAAWRDELPSRVEFLVERCRDRRILDIGCVAHDEARMQSPDWLHARLASAASSCLGVDVLDDGVAAMNRAGFEAIVHDLSTGPGRLAEGPPFDVIVAGELIEHVPDLTMLFRAAHDLLAPDGELILTTPNPYAPHRVEAGQRGDCWENTDHIMYAFPSGIAELAERAGMVLAEAMTTAVPTSRVTGIRDRARAARRWMRRTGWIRAGIATQGSAQAVRIEDGHAHTQRGARPARFVGETFVYVIRHRDGGSA